MNHVNTNQPLVSVIIPTYNHARFIKDAIRSVLNQTYKNLELIIVDNYSEDDTEKVVGSFKDRRIGYFKFRNHGIIAASRNFGIRKSSGAYIAFLDSDDIWLPPKLQRQIYHFQDKEVVAVGTQALWIRGPLISRKPFYRKNRCTDYRYRDFLFRNYTSCSSVIVRKDILLNLKGFDEHKDFLYIEDWELWLRVARMGKFRVLEEPLLFYRIPSVKKSWTTETLKRRFHILEKHIRFVQIAKGDINEAKANINLLIALNLLQEFNSENRKYFIELLKHASNFKTKLKASVGYFLSMLPPRFLKALLFLFYRLRELTYINGETKIVK